MGRIESTTSSIMLDQRDIAESDVYHLFSNFRRRESMSILWRQSAEMTLRELSEQIAAAEAEQSPAPRPLRESVYNTLDRTHLPKLHEFGLVEYDGDRKLVRPLPESRRYHRYMDTGSPVGMSWGEYYRGLGIVGLFVTTGSLAELPLLGAIEPIAYASLTLSVFAISTLYQLLKSPHGNVLARMGLR